MPDTSSLASRAGQESMERIDRLVGTLDGELGHSARDMLSRHGYLVDSEGQGPYSNVLGHPLVGLPVWCVGAYGGRAFETEIVFDIAESSVCGYLSVRADDDFFDGHWDDPEAAMMLSAFFRTRHQALLAPIVSDEHFWQRFQRLWLGYAEAMLLEKKLQDPSMEYGPDEFDRVLDRSQPLEIPANAVLSLTGRWDLVDQMSRLVRHLTKTTQLIDDFIDAPRDLADGNHSWMVRRLGGLEGARELNRGMIRMGDVVVSEATDELDHALELAAHMGLDELVEWGEERREVITETAQRMYAALFGALDAEN